MPIISQFFGVIIRMYYNDHAPPHFHAAHGEHEAIYEIETLRTLGGELPRREHGLVLKWARLHQAELRAAWKLAQAEQPPGRIAPLE